MIDLATLRPWACPALVLGAVLPAYCTSLSRCSRRCAWTRQWPMRARLDHRRGGPSLEWLPSGDMPKTKSPYDYSKSFRRALREVVAAQIVEGGVDPKSGVAEDLLTRADPQTVMSALLETVAMLATDDRPGLDPIARVDRAIDHLGRRKRFKLKR
jgi:hypothetical protein